MDKETNEYRKFLIERLGYFRNKSKMSARELSLRLGFSCGYIAKFEMGVLNMPSEVLMDAMRILNVCPEMFFCKKPELYERNNVLLENFEKLSDKSKNLINNLIQELK